MKKSNALTVILMVLVIVLIVICALQQLEIFAIADEISKIQAFVKNQLELNMTILDIIETLVH